MNSPSRGSAESDQKRASGLAEFIRGELGSIVGDWEQFAASIQPRIGEMQRDELRNHALHLLADIAQDLETPQSAREQVEKSHNLSPDSAPRSAAKQHGLQRLTKGFGITGVVGEFRALRASVIRLWGQKNPGAHMDHGDLIRFNEAIDQGIMETIESYSAEQEQQTRLFNTIISSSPDHGYILDPDCRFVFANQPMLDILRLSLDELSGRKLSELGLDTSTVTRMHRHARHVLVERQQCRGEVGYALPSGEQRYFEYVFSPVIDEDGHVEAVAATERDITERRTAEEQAWREANYDFLTGLPSRRLFRDRLDHDMSHARRSGSSLAVFFIDLDRFKELNDRLGHDAGDLLLKQVAQRIVGCVRAADTVARFAGDEFTTIVQDIDRAEEAAAIAKKLLAQLARPFSIMNETISVSGSIGIALFPQDATDPVQLLRNADQAMYAAKKAGRNRSRFFTRSMQQAASARLDLLGDLRNAVAGRQFEVYYQPIVDLSDDRIVKAEALLRWNHPRKGLLFPADFIDLATEEGLMDGIGNWVFTQAAERSLAWSQALDETFQISVNKSRVQFLSDESDWAACSRQLGVPGCNVAVEIAEDVLLNTSRDISDGLSRLHEAGIEVAVDNFGVGCCSMAYLKRFGIDYLKIDRSLVQSFATDVSSRTMAEAMISMAHGLGLKSIAEGVETSEQKGWLTRAGCNYAQGYLFAQAVPPATFERLPGFARSMH